MEQQNLLGERNLGIKIPSLSFLSPFPPIPRYYSPRRYLDGDQPRHWQNILNRDQAGVRLTTDSSRDVRVGGREGGNKVVTMRLTVDKKQFARRRNNREFVEERIYHFG